MTLLTAYEEETSGEVVEEFLDNFEPSERDEIYPSKEYRVTISRKILSGSYDFKVEQYSSNRRTPRSRMSAGTNKGPDILADIFHPETFKEEWQTRAKGSLEDLEEAKELLQ